METDMHVSTLLPRQKPGGDSSTDEFFKLVQDPFSSVLVTNAVWTSLVASIGTSLLLALLFSVLRPHHAAVYAPRLKRIRGGSALPPMGKGLLAWIRPVRTTRETQLVDAIGLDAVVFLRFGRMLRNMFLVMSIVGCGVLIPTNVAGSVKALAHGETGFTLMSPALVFGKPLWAQVICAWLFDVIAAYFLWYNYRIVRRLRRLYFESAGYQARLHSRTLMVTDIPKAYQSDEGVYRICEKAKPTSSAPRTVIGHEVTGLSGLIRQHEKTVRQLESCLARHLKNPQKVPTSRPRCKTAKEDASHTRGQKVDAIDYLTDRMQRLEQDIGEARKNIDLRAPMPYGFSSYDTVNEAHTVAYNARRGRRDGAVIKLAPPPEDIIWDNLPLTKSVRCWKKFGNTLWVALLTLIWVAPNALIAIFLANFANLGKVWPAFNRELQAHPRLWAAVQGIASPAILSLIYVLLPIWFRRLSIRAGDTTKTSRERHVLHQLYAFFVFNNLIVFTTFSAIWQFITAVVKARNVHTSVVDAIKQGELGTRLVHALCTVSPFWVTWLLQRNLSAAVDLAQVVNLFWIWFTKTFLSSTPRQREEWMRPPPFDYASYYNYFLFYATVALCFATLQPIVLPVAALYFVIDSWLKKYLLMYVFVTKTESGGQFWRVIYNRIVFAAILSNVVVALVVVARKQYPMAIATIPAPFMMIAFKLYCKKAFDADIHYYRKSLADSEGLPLPSKESLRNEKLATRFENPAFYKPLIAPMVSDKAKGMLSQIYRGRLHSETGNLTGHGGINLDFMSEELLGKTSNDASRMPFRFVPESLLAESNYQDQYRGNNESYGVDGMYERPMDLISERSQTPKSHLGHGPYVTPPYSRTASPAGYERNRTLVRTDTGGTAYSHYTGPYRSSSGLAHTQYPVDYHDTGPTAGDGAGFYSQPNESESGLLRGAADMPSSTASFVRPSTSSSFRRDVSADRWRANPRLHEAYGGPADVYHHHG